MKRRVWTQWVDTQGQMSGVSENALTPRSQSGWIPNGDVFEGSDDIVVKLELAGVDKAAIRITVEGRTLLIEGMREDPAGGESSAGYRFVQMEIEYGPFAKVIPLPFVVDGENASAHMNNGILRVRLPRAPAAEGKKINITMES